MAKGLRCPFCSTPQKSKLTLREVKSGQGQVVTHRECKGCGAIAWHPENEVAPGKPQQGKVCPYCRNNRLHLMHAVGGAEVYRCSNCKATVIIKTT